MGWALIVPFLRVDDPRAAWYTAAWLALLALPLGYWGTWLAGGGNRGGIKEGAIVAAAAGGALAVVPWAAGYGVAAPAEWGWSAAGLLAGALAARGSAHFLRSPAATKLRRPAAAPAGAAEPRET